MFHIRLILTGMTLFAVNMRSSAADELYDLRGPYPEKGQVFLLTAKSIGKDQKRITKIGDRLQEQKFDVTTLKKKEAEVLAVKGFEITKMRTKVVLDQREETGRRKKNNGMKIESELSGQTIYSVRTPNGWKNSLEDAIPTDKQAKSLKEYVPFKEEDLFYPKEKVKVGHEWKIESELFRKVLGSQFDEVTGTGTGKSSSRRVEKVDDENVAVVELTFELKGTSKEDDLDFDIVIKGKGTAHRSLKFGFDRTSVTELNTSMKGKGDIDGRKIEITFDGTTNTDESVELRKPKP